MRGEEAVNRMCRNYHPRTGQRCAVAASCPDDYGEGAVSMLVLRGYVSFEDQELARDLQHKHDAWCGISQAYGVEDPRTQNAHRQFLAVIQHPSIMESNNG